MERRAPRRSTTAGRGDDPLTIRGPVLNGVRRRVVRQLLWCSANGRDNPDVRIAHSIRVERNPLSVGGKAGERVSSNVGGEAPSIGSVSVGDPDVSVVAEGNLAVVADMRVADKFNGVCKADQRSGNEQQECDGKAEHGSEPQDSAREQDSRFSKLISQAVTVERAGRNHFCDPPRVVFAADNVFAAGNDHRPICRR